MKSIIGKTMMLAVITAALFSFSTNFGGEGFEIFLNNKVVVQKFNKDIGNVNELLLNNVSPTDQLTIKYYHCGRVGKNRIVSIRDGQNKLLKEWHFADGSAASIAMNCNVKDIISLRKNNNAVLKLYYSSSEIPNGRLLTNIVAANNSTVKLK